MDTADSARRSPRKYLMTIGAVQRLPSPKLDPQQHPDPSGPFRAVRRHAGAVADDD